MLSNGERGAGTVRAVRRFTPTLSFDQIPVERTWDVSMLLHDELHHTEPWEICERGCDALASRLICELFGKEVQQ